MPIPGKKASRTGDDMRIKEKPESESRDSDDAIPALAVSGGYSSDFMKRAKSGSGAHSPTPTASPSVAVTNHIFLSVYTPRLVPAGCLKWSTRSSINTFLFLIILLQLCKKTNWSGILSLQVFYVALHCYCLLIVNSSITVL